MKTHQLDYWHEDKPRCPNCGERFEVWEGDRPLALNYDDGGRTTFECDSCNKPFVCETIVKYAFSTAVSEEAADDEAWGPQEAAA
jgi:hypothetical protein